MGWNRVSLLYELVKPKGLIYATWSREPITIIFFTHNQLRLVIIWHQTCCCGLSLAKMKIRRLSTYVDKHQFESKRNNLLANGGEADWCF